MTARRSYHVVFALALVALFALGTAWTWLVWRASGLEREVALRRLEVATLRTAGECGDAPRPWPIGPLPGTQLEVVPAGSPAREGLIAPCAPHHFGLAIRATEEAIQAVDRKLRRRHIQFHGESATLLLLLGVCTVMLYRLVRAERLGVERMREFLATVTHEMKTPLAGIKSLLQTMAAGRVPEEECPRLVGLGLKETERLEHMVDNVLMSGRLRTAALRVHLEELRLHDLLEAFVEHRRRYLLGQEAKIVLRWEAGDESLAVQADANALRVILENLTDNAFKYGGDRGQVSLVVTRQGETARVAVVDRGVGFAPDEAVALFAPFRRAGSGAGRQQHGTGLGLSLSLALARRMGGDLEAASDGPGQGASFTVTLPVAAQ